MLRPARLAVLTLIAGCLTLAACDSGGDIEPLGGLIYVSLESSTTLLLESELDLPCGPRIATEQQTLGGRFSVTVLGLEPTSGTCTGLAPVRRTLTIEPGSATTFPIDIIYGGFVDEYRYTAGRAGSTPARLDSVRTDVTRLGRRPQ